MAGKKTEFTINTLANDLQMNPLDLLEYAENHGLKGIKSDAFLEVDEFDILLNALTLDNQIKDINSYIDGKTVIVLNKEDTIELPQDSMQCTSTKDNQIIDINSYRTEKNAIAINEQVEEGQPQRSMQYTSELFAEFLNKLIIFDKECKSILDAAERSVKLRSNAEKSEWECVRERLDSKVKIFSERKTSLIRNNKRKIESIILQDMNAKSNVFSRLQKCKGALSVIVSVEKSITSKDEYESNAKSQPLSSTMSVDEILSGIDAFVSLAYQVNIAIRNGRKRELASKGAQLYGMCRRAEDVLNAEISKLKTFITANKDNLHADYASAEADLHQQLTTEWDDVLFTLDEMTAEFVSQKKDSATETAQVVTSSLETKHYLIKKLIDNFCEKFPPREFACEYARIYSLEPKFDYYECVKEMPRNIYISTLEYDVSRLQLCDFTKEFLEKYYYFMYRKNKLLIPYCAQFNSEFNYIFKFSGEGRAKVVKDACEIGMRLFMMLPPGKVNFTFVDPVTLGESFAMFTRLVDIDDRTSEIINGKIWSAPSDIEDKLKIMTNHISNVTQRCLQGKYDNIFEYNQVAEQNAEAYQILMLMDYPAGLSDQSLKLLEQIVTSGPKCGVFTVIYRNESQYKKVSERSYPLIKNIESNFRSFNYSDDAMRIVCTNEPIKGQQFLWTGIKMPNTERMDKIIATLKKGIKYADRVVIDINKVDNADVSTSTIDGFRIPIGIHGANEIQYLTLGVGGSHHALVAGITRSGKSSLLHTIILRSLKQYSPDELEIYLVDFKRGVEFKIYADYILPSFKVVAIETEREFGYNILENIEREQRVRASIFKKNRVDKIEEYRAIEGKKMPRVLVIMDEFHELFTSGNDDLAKKSSVIMERIVRQGAAFGIHMILSSQSYSNITGIDKAVFDQMAVRIVLKCSKADANLLLDGGSTEIDQISIDDPGRAVYNSEAGNKEYNSHFRVAYIEPEKHRGMLQDISDSTKKFVDDKQPTRILLSNIEDNNYSIFNQFITLNANTYKTPGRLYIGEPLSISNSMALDFSRNEYSNLLMIGGDMEKARSMFAFSILSLCINYKITHQQVPGKPFIYLFNCKPLDDSYFKDTPKLLAEFLPEYIQYVGCGDTNRIQSIVSQMYDDVSEGTSDVETDKYFFVFGYQRAEELKSEIQLSQSQNIDSLFNIMPASSNKPKLSIRKMFRAVVEKGAQKGVHTIIWQDSFNALYQDDKDIMSYFSMKIAFDMSPEEYSRFVSANDVSLMSENNAIYYNRARDNQKFRPYQSPDEDWLENISEKLK